MARSVLLLFLVGILSSCSNEYSNNESVGKQVNQASEEVNIYSARKGYLLKPLLVEFENDTNIKVNIISGKSKALQKRIQQEGKNTRADVLLTVDAGNLYKAKADNLLKRIDSKQLNKLIPSHLRDDEGYWYGLSIRSRVIMFNPQKVNIKELSTYDDLANPKWKGRICLRSSSNIYNQSLLASLISHLGEEKAEGWASKVVSNFSRKPKGNDRAQAKAIYSGECDIVLMNTYYFALMKFNEKKPEQKNWARATEVIFYNQGNRGQHVNISGAAIAKYSKNSEEALRFIEWLTMTKAQKIYANVNFEYPVNPKVKLDGKIMEWGNFKSDSLPISAIAKNSKKAQMIIDQVGW